VGAFIEGEKSPKMRFTIGEGRLLDLGDVWEETSKGCEEFEG
jgi:hypothetical protein